MEYVATCPRGFEDLLIAELHAVGITQTTETRAAVSFSGSLEQAMRLCLWSRIASRVLCPIYQFTFQDENELYDECSKVPWAEHFAVDKTFAVDVTLQRNDGHSQYFAQRVKDAIVDQFRTQTGTRPSVDTKLPNIRVLLHVKEDKATLNIDLVGRGLHQRGYRRQAVEAPLKENVAAAMLLRLKWPELAAQQQAFLDPMCGSGTLVIEAALMAADIAPGIFQSNWSFLHWQQGDRELWRKLCLEAEERASTGRSNMPAIYAADDSTEAVMATRSNIIAAGLDGSIKLQKADATQWACADAAGLLLVNPPYGERLSEISELLPLYLQLGQHWQKSYGQWQLGLLTSEESLARATGLRADKHWRFDNGPLECRLYKFSLQDQKGQRKAPSDLVNRLQKNRKHLARWAKREDVTCYRVYDADLPVFASAIDIYQSDKTYAYVQEYAPPAIIPEEKSKRRLRETMQAVAEVFDLPAQQIVCKTRSQQKGSEQYQKVAETGQRVVVAEGPLQFYVNLWDYLDTGLFLDHRPTRQRLLKEVAGKTFLNLFSYTGAASVYAAAVGAATTSVDMSNTYLDWSRDNFKLNRFTGEHEFIRADVLQWLDRAVFSGHKYDMIFCDPPSFSNSKKMLDVFDLQRQHSALIDQCMQILAPDGVLIFSNNNRQFKLDAQLLEQYQVENVTRRSIPEDFKRNQKIHHCWDIRHH